MAAYRSSTRLGWLARTSMSIPFPAGTASNDLLLIATIISGNRTGTIVAPSGFTTLGNYFSGSYTWSVFAGITDGVTTPVVGWGGVSTSCGALVGAYSGAHPTSPTYGFIQATGTSGAPSVSGVTTTEANAVVVFITQNAGAASTSAPTGFTMRFDDTDSDQAIADRSYAIPGATGTLTGGFNTAQAFAASALAIRNAPAGTVETATAGGSIAGGTSPTNAITQLRAGGSYAPGDSPDFGYVATVAGVARQLTRVNVTAPSAARPGDLLAVSLYLDGPAANLVPNFEQGTLVTWTEYPPEWVHYTWVLRYEDLADGAITWDGSLSWVDWNVAAFRGASFVGITANAATSYSRTPGTNITSGTVGSLLYYAVTTDTPFTYTQPSGMTLVSADEYVFVAVSQTPVTSFPTGLRQATFSSNTGWTVVMLAIPPYPYSAIPRGSASADLGGSIASGLAATARAPASSGGAASAGIEFRGFVALGVTGGSIAAGDPLILIPTRLPPPAVFEGDLQIKVEGGVNQIAVSMPPPPVATIGADGRLVAYVQTPEGLKVIVRGG